MSCGFSGYLRLRDALQLVYRHKSRSGVPAVPVRAINAITAKRGLYQAITPLDTSHQAASL